MSKPSHFILDLGDINHDFKVLGFQGREAISQPYRFDVELVSEYADFDLDSLLGQPAYLAYSPSGSGVHGLIEQIFQGDSGSRLTRYHLTLVPQLSQLGLRRNARIFQHLTVPQIIAQLLEEHGIQAGAYRFQLGPTIYPARDYCVQYGETDLHFVQRLCEEEGLHYHFQHSSEAHVLVFGDDQTVFHKLGRPTAYLPDSGMVATEPVIKHFGVRLETRTSAVIRRDYDFQKPRLQLESSTSSRISPTLQDYAFPGQFTERSRGKHLAQRALERHRADFQQATGDSDQSLLVSGHFFELSEHPRVEWNQLWLLTGVEHEGKQPQVLEEVMTCDTVPADGFQQGYRNRFTATPWDVPFRPPLKHPKPRLLSSQSAVVTGPAGEEIHCDEYGRVKVQFHWDRDGRGDDTSSCWLRVASGWAGDRYGSLAIPRVGMEVLVSFLEGDPDQPLITGCLHHKTHPVPYDLPAHKTRSLFKTLSAPGGGGSNELRIEDKQGAEQIYLHAQRDWEQHIRRDQTLHVGHQRHDTVVANSYSEFKAEEHHTTHGDRRSEVRADDHLSVGASRHTRIGTGQFIEAGDEIHYHAGNKVVIDAGMELTASGGGSWLKLDPGGVSFSGTQVKINSGGNAGVGSGIGILPAIIPGVTNMAVAANLLTPPAANTLEARQPPQLDGEPAHAKQAQRQADEFEEEEEEEEIEPAHDTPQSITLRIGMFFDGTGNNQANAAMTEQCRRDDLALLDDGTLQATVVHCQAYGYRDLNSEGQFRKAPDNSYGNAASNVALLFDLYKDESDQPLASDTQSASIKIYLEGIGTTSGKSDSILSQATGGGATGVVARVEQSPQKLRTQIRTLIENNPNIRIQHIEFDIFGFSRGAAAARHFANEVLKPQGGLLADTLNAHAHGFVSDFDWITNASINFIGLFDTVAAVVDPLNGDFSPGNHLNNGVNLYLPPGCARKVVQLVARDELRWNFALNSVAPHHQEIVLPGVHSDIGGGYPSSMTEKLLLSKPRQALVTLARPLERSPAWQQTQEELSRLEDRGLPGNGTLNVISWRLPTPRRSAPPTEKRLVAVAIERRVRSELSRVYLRAMHDLASRHEVPLEAIDPNDLRSAIPEEIQPIAQKILMAVHGQTLRLSIEEERVLHAGYIHLSAHWTPSAGLLINKPAPNRRLAYNNAPHKGYPQ